MKEATINLSESQLRQVQASENGMYQTIEHAMQKRWKRAQFEKEMQSFRS